MLLLFLDLKTLRQFYTFLDNILYKRRHIYSDAISYAFAASHTCRNFEPAGQGKVDSFCDIEPEVKARVISSCPRYYEFSWVVDHFCHFDSLLEHKTRVDQRILMSDVFRTFFEVVGKPLLKELFEFLIAVQIN